MRARSGYSLVEILLCIGILTILMGLLMVAVQDVRRTALRAHSTNNLKQIVLGTQALVDANGGWLPAVDGSSPANEKGKSMFFALLPFIEHGNYYAEVKAGTLPNSSDYSISQYISPADPTLPNPQWAPGLSSYPANAVVFTHGAKMSGSFFRDGTAYTIAFAEHYSHCGPTFFNWWYNIGYFPGNPSHAASFADKQYGDVYPVGSGGNPPVTNGSIPGLTFQVRPNIQDCDPRVPQTPHAGGMLAAFADGSVTTLSARMSATSFWSAVTPDGGEPSGSDW